MCQQAIIKYLAKKKGKPVDMKELLIKLPANRASLSRSCKKLRECNEIKYKKKKERCYEKFVYFL